MLLKTFYLGENPKIERVADKIEYAYTSMIRWWPFDVKVTYL